MISPQDIAIKNAELLIFSYWNRKFPNKKTFDTVLLWDVFFKGGIVSPGALRCLDGKYTTVNDKDFDEILDLFWAKNKRWIAEEFDCDKFAIEFKSFCVKFGVTSCGLVLGKMGSGDHAFNCFVNSNLDVFIIEPQTCLKVKYEKDKEIKISGAIYKPIQIIL